MCVANAFATAGAATGLVADAGAAALNEAAVVELVAIVALETESVPAAALLLVLGVRPVASAIVGAVGVAGTDSRAPATGADIAKINSSSIKTMMFDDYFERNWWRIMPSFRKPVIAAINGMAFGGDSKVQ